MISVDELMMQIRDTKRRNLLIWCAENTRRMVIEIEREFGTDAAIPLAAALDGIDKLKRRAQHLSVQTAISDIDVKATR